MKLGICCFAYDEGRSGISEYINQCLKYLSKSEEDIYCFIPHYEFDCLPEPLKFSKLNFIVINIPKSKVLELLFTFFLLPLYFLLFKIDVVFFPAGNRRLSYVLNRKSVVTFHDLSQYHIEGKYDVFRTFYIKHIVPHFLKKVSKIFAISKATKKDIENFFYIEGSKVEVNYNGYDPSLVGTRVEKKKEILYVSRIEHPGKNHLNLLKAFKLLPEEIKSQYQLVFAGKEWSGAEVVKKFITEEDLSEHVNLTGFLDSKDLANYYARAELFVHPSFFEGFGLPLLEAMNNQLKLCVSDIEVFKEVCAKSADYFNPRDPEDIALKIKSLIEKDQVFLDYSERLKLFNWSDHFSKIYASCKELKDRK